MPTFTGSAEIVKSGSTIVWSKWISGAKESLRPQYGSQVESLERTLPEEIAPVYELELTSAAVSTIANITVETLFRQEQKEYEEWTKGAETQSSIRLAILDKCNSQVKKTLFATHDINAIENRTCKITDFISWIRIASRDPTLSTYAMKKEGEI